MKGKKLSLFLLFLLIASIVACSGVETPEIDTSQLDAAQETAANAQATADAALAALEAAASGDEEAQAALEAQLAEAQAALEAAESAVAEAEAEAEAEAAAAEEAAMTEPVDIELWALATVTEAGPPPDDWVAYDIIRDELGINFTYVIVPPGQDGEAKLNAAAAANELPDIFQMVSSTGDTRGALYRYANLGLLAPVDDMMPLMPQRTELHYNDPLAIGLSTFVGQQFGLPEPPALRVQRGQPAAAVATSVDALQMGQIEDFTAGLRRVPDDGHLAGAVRLGQPVPQRFPAEPQRRLVFQRHVRPVRCMDEEVGRRLVERNARLDERHVFCRKPSGSGAETIGIEGCHAAA